MLVFGLWWLGRAAETARRRGEGFGDNAPSLPGQFAEDENLRARAAMAHEFDPAEIVRGEIAVTRLPTMLAALPLIVVIGVNLAMSLFVLPALNTSFLAEPRWGGTSLSAVGGVWSVVTALACGIAMVLAVNGRRIPHLRTTVDAGA